MIGSRLDLNCVDTLGEQREWWLTTHLTFSVLPRVGEWISLCSGGSSLRIDAIYHRVSSDGSVTIEVHCDATLEEIAAVYARWRAPFEFHGSCFEKDAEALRDLLRQDYEFVDPEFNVADLV